MDTTEWTKRADDAPSEAELLGVVREYMAAKASLIALLPIQCRPVNVTSQGVIDSAYRLAAYHSHGDDARVVLSVAPFFARASVRLSELRGGR